LLVSPFIIISSFSIISRVLLCIRCIFIRRKIHNAASRAMMMYVTDNTDFRF
jgi:hypothetical protein